jgi:hypothetical protein
LFILDPPFPGSTFMANVPLWHVKAEKDDRLLSDHHFRDFLHGSQIDALGTGLRAAFISPGDETLVRGQQLCPF